MTTSFPFFTMIVVAFLSAVPLRAEPAKPLDVEVKATYLLNFGRFATWPVDTPDPAEQGFPLCVIGRDPFGSVLDHTVTGETIDGRAVVVRRIATAPETNQCRILFVSGSEESRLAAILALAEKAGVLTVSDIPRFTDRGGMIQFVLEDKRVRFRVNAVAVGHARLTLSSELLRVASAVVRSSP
jgi:hypothetical protein